MAFLQTYPAFNNTQQDNELAVAQSNQGLMRLIEWNLCKHNIKGLQSDGV
jgi:hypothetical protein